MAGDLGSQSGADSDASGTIASINVTPFVDVVLVLLVIFMVTAPLIARDALNLNLPTSKSVDESAARSLGVAITRQGQILLDGVVSSEAELLSRVSDRLKADPQVQALISADQDSRHGDVVRAMDLLKRAGLKRFAVQIRKE